MESRLPQAVAPPSLPIISCLSAPDTFRPSLSIRAPFKLSGDPQTIGEARTFSVSQNGVLAYHESSAQSELKLFDRSGNLIGTPGPLGGLFRSPFFSRR